MSKRETRRIYSSRKEPDRCGWQFIILSTQLPIPMKMYSIPFWHNNTNLMHKFLICLILKLVCGYFQRKMHESNELNGYVNHRMVTKNGAVMSVLTLTQQRIMALMNNATHRTQYGCLNRCVAKY